MVVSCQPIFLVGTLGQIEVEMSKSNFCTFAIYYGKSFGKKKKKTFQTCFLDTSIHITNGSKHRNMVQNGGVRSLIASCFWQCRC